MLKTANYIVLEAANAQAAIAIVKSHQGTIHLILTDVVMPHTSGTSLADILSAEVPRAKVILMSGHAAAMLSRYARPWEKAVFIEKPFTKHELLSTIHAVLRDQ
jgi:two-component system, cell cycle sensor histidine kinase and response regulator CckA